MTTKIDPKDVQVGDRVTLTGTVRYISDKPLIAVDGDDRPDRCLAFSQAELAHATIERPVDPDLVAAREFYAQACIAKGHTGRAERSRQGEYDSETFLRAIILAVKALKA